MTTNPFRIVHTNDWHNGWSEAKETALRAVLDAPDAPPTLYLDAGDAIKAGNVGVSLGGEPILEKLSALGCAAMTLGNREFHVSRPLLQKKISDARFPVLCANLRSKTDGGSVPTVPYKIFTVGQARVAVFGLTVPMVTERMAARHLSDFLFDDPIKTASELVPELREQADFVIALTHLGIKSDERLAESVTGIDLIVGGHTHVVLETPKWLGETPIAQAGSHGRFVGEVVLDRGKTVGRLVAL
jgi:2',3'-cyclic-nucleotide 2'-phosphodiesterase (5'-nucleotidase family)